MPLYHTMGIHSLIAMHLVGGCFVSQARWDVEEALRADPGASGSRSLYLAPTLFHDLVDHPRLGDVRPLRRCEALALRRRRDDARARRALRRGVPAAASSSTTTARPRSTRSRSHRDQAAKPGCAGRAVRSDARLRLDERRRDRSAAWTPTRRSPATGPARRRREGDPRRLVPHGRHRPPRRGRRSLGRRPRRRHDHLGRREHPSARGRGRARAPPEGRARSRWSARPTSGSGQRVVAVVVADGEVTAEELDAHCLASTSSPASSGPREYRFVDDAPEEPVWEDPATAV